VVSTPPCITYSDEEQSANTPSSPISQVRVRFQGPETTQSTPITPTMASHSRTQPLSLNYYRPENHLPEQALLSPRFSDLEKPSGTVAATNMLNHAARAILVDCLRLSMESKSSDHNLTIFSHLDDITIMPAGLETIDNTGVQYKLLDWTTLIQFMRAIVYLSSNNLLSGITNGQFPPLGA
jgi:hypothetical protein